MLQANYGSTGSNVDPGVTRDGSGGKDGAFRLPGRARKSGSASQMERGFTSQAATSKAARRDGYRCMLRILVYLGRTRSLGTRYTGKATDASTLRAYADANWDIVRSVTGFVIVLACGTVLSCSKRQHCISMSSCESELIALADCAIELLYLLNLLAFLGHESNS